MRINKIKVFLVDDQPFFRIGIANQIKRYKRIAIVGESNNSEEYLNKVKSLFPDVVLMDVKLNKINGIEAILKSSQTYPRIKIIAMTFESEKECTYNLIQAGVSGLLFKDASIKEIVETIVTVFEGNYYFSKCRRC